MTHSRVVRLHRFHGFFGAASRVTIFLEQNFAKKKGIAFRRSCRYPNAQLVQTKIRCRERLSLKYTDFFLFFKLISPSVSCRALQAPAKAYPTISMTYLVGDIFSRGRSLVQGQFQGNWKIKAETDAKRKSTTTSGLGVFGRSFFLDLCHLHKGFTTLWMRSN